MPHTYRVTLPIYHSKECEILNPQACQVDLTSLPQGESTADDFRLIETGLPAIASGRALLQMLYLWLDPYMRGRMSAARGQDPGQSQRLGGGNAPRCGTLLVGLPQLPQTFRRCNMKRDALALALISALAMACVACAPIRSQDAASPSVDSPDKRHSDWPRTGRPAVGGARANDR